MKPMTSSTHAQWVMDSYVVPPRIQTQQHTVSLPQFPGPHYLPPEIQTGQPKPFPSVMRIPFEESERPPLPPSLTFAPHSVPDTQQWLTPTPNNRHKSTTRPSRYSIPSASIIPYHDFDLDGAHMTVVSISRARRHHPYGNPRRLAHLDSLPRMATGPLYNSHVLNYNGLPTPVSTPPFQHTRWLSDPATQLQPWEFSGNEQSTIPLHPRASQEPESWTTFPLPQSGALPEETYDLAPYFGGIPTPATSTSNSPIEEHPRSLFSPPQEGDSNSDVNLGFDTDFFVSSARVPQVQNPHEMVSPLSVRPLPQPQQDPWGTFHQGAMPLAIESVPNAQQESTSTPSFVIIEPASGRAPRQRQRGRISPLSAASGFWRRRSDATPKACRPCLVRDGDRLCNKVFETIQAFVKHFKDEHDAPGSHDDKTKVTCAWEGCRSQLQNGSTLRHLKEHISGVVCTECGGMFARTDTFNVHWGKKHLKVEPSATSSIMVLV